MMKRFLYLSALLSFFISCGAETKEYVVTFNPNNGSIYHNGLVDYSVGKFYISKEETFSDFSDLFPVAPWSSGSKLTDGDYGKASASTKYCLGWNRPSVEIICDLGKYRKVEKVAVHAVSLKDSSITFPESVKVALSKDKTTWEDVDKILSFNGTGKIETDLWGEVTFKETECRYIKLNINKKEESKGLLIDEFRVLGKYEEDLKYVPKEGVYHGAFPPLYGFDESDRHGVTDKCAIILFEELVQKQLSMVLWYQNMTEGRNFSEMQQVRSAYWGKNYDGNYRFFIYGWLPTISSKLMAEGQLDTFHISYFSELLDDNIKNLGPVWFRPANEMNGGWTPYYGDPVNYVKAWRRMYNIAEQLGLTKYNVFVWSPNSYDSPAKDTNRMKMYYPGDTYVDWIGISMYPPSLSATFTENLRYPNTLIQGIKKISATKPIMISEGGYSDSCDHMRWVREWFSFKDNEPRIKAMIWENHINSVNGDRRLQSDPAALNIYRDLVKDPYWLDKIPAEVEAEIQRRKQ